MAVPAAMKTIEDKSPPLEGEPMIKKGQMVEDEPAIEGEIIEALRSPIMVILDDSDGSPPTGSKASPFEDEELCLEGANSPKSPSSHGGVPSALIEEVRGVVMDAEAQGEPPIEGHPSEGPREVEGEAKVPTRTEEVEQGLIGQEGLLEEEKTRSEDSPTEVLGGKGKQVEIS